MAATPAWEETASSSPTTAPKLGLQVNLFTSHPEREAAV
jgi:hypothetical protein